MIQITREALEAELKNATWEQEKLREDATKEDPTADLWKGISKGWTFSVCSFDIEPQGFPAGSRGYDGAGSYLSEGGSLVIHLPRDLAELGYQLAKGGKDGHK